MTQDRHPKSYKIFSSVDGTIGQRERRNGLESRWETDNNNL